MGRFMIDSHLREMTATMSDAELDALEAELLEKLAEREDRFVFSREREDKVINFGLFVLGSFLSVCVYQLLQLAYLHLTSVDAEWNVLLLCVIAGVCGFGGAALIFAKAEARLRRGLMFVVRHREFVIYAALFLFSLK